MLLKKKREENRATAITVVSRQQRNSLTRTFIFKLTSKKLIKFVSNKFFSSNKSNKKHIFHNNFSILKILKILVIILSEKIHPTPLIR